LVVALPFHDDEDTEDAVRPHGLPPDECTSTGL